MMLVKTKGYDIKGMKHISDRDKERIYAKYVAQVKEDETYQPYESQVATFVNGKRVRVELIALPLWGWYIVNTTNQKEAKKLIKEYQELSSIYYYDEAVVFYDKGIYIIDALNEEEASIIAISIKKDIEVNNEN